MALRKMSLEKIAALLKISAKTLEDSIKDEKEVDLEIDDNLQTFSKTDLESRDRGKYAEGKKAGEEMLIKDAKKKHNLEGDINDTDGLVEAIGKKAVADANIPVDEKLKEKDKLILAHKQKQVEAEQALAGEKEKTIAMSNSLKFRSILPKGRTNVLEDDEFVGALANKYRWGVDDKNGEALIDIATGEVVRDPKTLATVQPKDVAEGYFKTRQGWLEDAGAGGTSGNGGRGGGNSKIPENGVFKKMSEVRAKAEAEGVNVNGSKFKAMASQAIKDNPELEHD